VGHRIEECLPFSGIFDLLQLLRQVEIIPADDSVLGSNELAERLSESTERPGKPRGRDAGRVQD
jgi:hypothetical protein